MCIRDSLRVHRLRVAEAAVGALSPAQDPRLVQTTNHEARTTKQTRKIWIHRRKTRGKRGKGTKTREKTKSETTKARRRRHKSKTRTAKTEGKTQTRKHVVSTGRKIQTQRHHGVRQKNAIQLKPGHKIVESMVLHEDELTGGHNKQKLTLGPAKASCGS